MTDPDQTDDLCLRCSPMPFWQATNVENFRTITFFTGIMPIVFTAICILHVDTFVDHAG